MNTAQQSHGGESASSNKALPLISIVDDDESVRVALKSLIDSVGFHAATFSSGSEFLHSSALRDTACLIVDVRMPGMSGLELQKRLNAIHSSIPIVFISAHDDSEAQSRGIEAGAVDFLLKPFSESDLMRAINIALGVKADGFIALEDE